MYVKVFSSLYQGTLYGQLGPQVVFIYLLAHADADGNVTAAPLAIAGATGLGLDQVMSAFEVLEGEDPNSTTPDDGGRRLMRIGSSWMWNITNYFKYRNMQDRDTVREQTRERVRKHRNGKKRSVTVGNGSKRQGEVEVEVEAIESKHLSLATRDDEAVEFFLNCFWPEYPRKSGVSKKKAQQEFVRAVRGHVGDIDDLATSIMAALTKHKAEWEGKEEQFIPHPSTWITQRRWEV